MLWIHDEGVYIPLALLDDILSTPCYGFGWMWLRSWSAWRRRLPFNSMLWILLILNLSEHYQYQHMGFQLHVMDSPRPAEQAQLMDVHLSTPCYGFVETPNIKTMLSHLKNFQLHVMDSTTS